MKIMSCLMFLALATPVHAEKWNKSNNPAVFNLVAKAPMNYDFKALPLVAKLNDERLAWSETYWPSNRGGIAYRWNSPNPENFSYKLKKKEELIKMSEEELSELSPAELYDISQGDYSYSLTKKVLRTYSPKELWWEGICHGWSQAASNYPEPDKTIVLNKDGVKVPFGSSDVKGLLAMHDAFNSKGLYVRVGERCSVNGKVAGEELPQDGVVPKVSEKDANSSDCSDVNAGAFHIVLTNMIGVNSQGFVADVDRYNDVWNQPVSSYAGEILGEVTPTEKEIKNGIVKKVRMKTVMTYAEELVFYTKEKEEKGILGFVSKDPVTGTPKQTFSAREYEYILELDAAGKIIGGEWISATRPDMLWTKKRDAEFRNGRFPLSGLKDIYVPKKI